MKLEKLQLLAPFGEHEHFRGTQLVDEIAADKMIANARSFFPKKIPVYVGHPDEHGESEKPFGFVRNLYKAKCGIVAAIEYSDSFLASNEVFSGLSPRWRMEPLRDGRFRPVQLISVGLTNNPNIERSGELL